MEYTPYKMVGHTLPGIKQKKPAAAKMKAFGTKDSEMPDKISTTPTKFMGGMFGAARGMMEKIKARRAAEKAKGAAGGEEEVGQAPDPSLMEAEANAVSEGADDGGGAVEPHGPEAHTGGGRAMGGMKKKRGIFNPFGGGKFGGGIFGSKFSNDIHEKAKNDARAQIAAR